MMKPGVYVHAAKFFFEYEEMLNKTMGRPLSDEELASELEMTARMVEAIKWRFSRDGKIAVTLEEIAPSMGISMERVRQLVGLGLRKIRYAMYKEGIDGYH